MNYIQIVMTFVSSIIGAGFASGQELKIFFANFGPLGFLGLSIVALLFFYLGYRIMWLCFSLKIISYNELIAISFPKKTQKFLDYLIILFLIGTAMTMSSGAGAIFKETFLLNPCIGSFLLLTISIIMIFLGIEKINKLNLFIVPILIIITSIISISSYKNSILTIQNTSTGFISSAIIYVSYNIVMALSIIPALANTAKSKNDIKKSAIISSIIIFIFGSIIVYALLSNYNIIKNFDVPLMSLAKNTGTTFSYLYLISFFIAVFTTCVSCLYGVFLRIHKKKTLMLSITVITYLGSLLGFSVLVKYLYSFMGYVGIIILLGILFTCLVKNNT